MKFKLAVVSLTICLIIPSSSGVKNPCKFGQFQCRNGNCINQSQKCDGNLNCKDGSDENFLACHNFKCAAGKFQCSYGGCISQEKQCDGRRDCLDATDENLMECGNSTFLEQYEKMLQGECNSAFQCKSNKRCLERSQICDGVRDCEDASDESLTLCGGAFCEENSFRCKYGACIDLTSVCNLHEDCADGSDEINEICTAWDNNFSNTFGAEIHCDEQHFRCEDRSCIDLNQKCDGKRNCKDGSDEIFQTCYNFECNENFQCAYGGCVTPEKICDGQNDCWDGSDENVFDCSNSSKLEQITKDLMGVCAPEFQCKSKDHKCIALSLICDGGSDCLDASDEVSTLCAGISCPANSFRCAYGACIEQVALCNHIVDCADGSDELPEICLGNQTDNSEASLNLWSVKHCTLEDMPANMRAEDYFVEHSYKLDSLVPTKSVVHLSCDQDYMLQGDAINSCFNGQWTHKWPQCLRTCKQSAAARNISYTSHCIYEDRLVDCKKSTNFAGTQMHISCASGYMPSKVQASGLQTCNENGFWQDEKPGRLECEALCGQISRTQVDMPAKPWTVSIFERTSVPYYTFKCSGTIISPLIVVTSPKCFSENTAGYDPMEHTIYAVAEGQHDEDFNQNELHGYQLHNISKITIHSTDVPTTEASPLAVLQMINPFIFSATVKPICIDFNIVVDPRLQLALDYATFQQGYALDKKIENLYYLELIVVDRNTSLNVFGFKGTIQNMLKWQIL